MSHGGARAAGGIGWKLASVSSQHVRQMLRLYIGGHTEGNYTRKALPVTNCHMRIEKVDTFTTPDFMC